MFKGLVSIIMPVYNCEPFLHKAIGSVLKQTHANFELLIVNDGSTDNSKAVIKNYDDPRIKYFEQKNQGVSSARNVALRVMKGEYFCFLDADDYLPDRSLEDRLNVFREDKDIEFVDGGVRYFHGEKIRLGKRYQARFVGNPFSELLSLSGKCFFGPSWMIKKDTNKIYEFDESLTHGEDLLFYLSISQTGVFSFTPRTIYMYRVRENSAMSDLNSLLQGYKHIQQTIGDWAEVNKGDLFKFSIKSRLIMMKSFLSRGKILSAIKVLS